MVNNIGANGREDSGATIDKEEVRKAVSTNSLDNLNRLAIGAVEVDKNGKILEYSEAESNLSGFSPVEVKGKNFFEDVAPCTNYGDFRSYFDEIVAGKREEATFDFLMTNFSPPINVQVMLKRSLIDQKFWIFIKRHNHYS